MTRKFTGGTGRSLHRINATAFLEDLLNNHNFIEGEIQDINAIRNSIPQQYIADFNRGLTL